MDAKRLSQLTKCLVSARKMGAKLNGKSAIEKEIKNWVDEPPITLTGDTVQRPEIDFFSDTYLVMNDY